MNKIEGWKNVSFCCNRMNKKGVHALLCILIFFLFHPLAFSSAKKTRNIPRLSREPVIDGVLDNPLWKKEALIIEDFRQMTPKEMGEPSEKTVTYIGYDEKNLYFAFRCYDSKPEKIWASITNRDHCIEDDWVAVFLDAFNEKRRAFTFIINPVGIQMDCLRIEEGGNDNMDDSWDTVFRSEGKIDEEGYIVEMAIPFKSLRFPDKEKKVWGLTLGRNIPRKGEIILWPEFSRQIPGLLTQSSEIVIQGRVEKGKNFELMPVITSLKTKDEKADPQPGVNFKWGANSDLTMDLTLNPDFSHIEADSPQIDANLRFALRYAEKRPFFLEGMEIFNFPEIEMVYTRRIIDPTAGAKLTGKLGRFTYGLLSAYDANPTESLWQVHNGKANPNDNALFNIFRMKTDVFKESYLGFCLADKEIDGTYNRVVGLDGQFKFRRNFFFSFQAIASKTKFEERETGVVPALYAEFSYFSKYWGTGVWWQSMHPYFEASSGFVNRVDYRSLGGYAHVDTYPQKKFMNQIRLSLSGGRRDAYFENDVQDLWARANVNLRFTEFSQMNINFQSSMENFSRIDFHKKSLSISAQNTLISWLPFGFYLQTGQSLFYDPDDPYLGWSNVYEVSVTFKPSKRLRMGVDFSKQTFWKERGGEQIYDYNVIRQRTNYQISRTLSLRTIVDYNHFDKQIFGSFLVSYVYRPGTVFFFGVDNDLLRREDGRYGQTDYSIFFKFSYWWRI